LAGLLSYLVVYTPMKRGSSLAVVVGAFPGAVPVLMGWAGARGSVDEAGWSLFAILFLWQVPHFLAINWMYRADYERARFRMLTDADPEGDAVVRQALLYALALLPVSLLPGLHAIAGSLYVLGAIALGLYYLRGCLILDRERTGEAGRALLKVSVIYLPLLFALLLFDRMLPGLLGLLRP
jgi:protoheme IX farnesyltransferase